ncbi:hypothetical protein C8Q76DRAFT_619567 [Earliella scabrosa]|nr:hypothetical protein C8Q76DRAFT_619567 [Earliella scabrosa]
MGRLTHKSQFDLNKLPSEEELEEFEEADEDAGACCTIDDFRPDLNGTPRSKWNTSIAEVFVEAYMAEGTFVCDDRALVRKYFVRHLRYLISMFKDRHTEQEVKLARLKQKRRRERRNYLFQRRLKAASTEPDLKRHVYILQRLGPEGMSSDESAMENGVKQFRILKKDWRSPHLTAWLRVFDGINREQRFNPLTESTRGADPRHRFESGKASTSSRAVSCLPINAYNPTWYEERTPYARQRLQARKKAYDFTHTPEIVMFVVMHRRITTTHISIHSQANEANGQHIERRARRFR